MAVFSAHARRKLIYALAATLSLLAVGAIVVRLMTQAQSPVSPVTAAAHTAAPVVAAVTASPSSILLPSPQPASSPVHSLTNLLANGTFESGSFDGWEEASGGASISTADHHSGNSAARLNNTSIRTRFATTPGKTYKVTGWVRIASESSCPGCWGGMRFAVDDGNWQEIGSSGALLTAAHGNTWFKIAFAFVAATNATPMDVGYFGDPDRAMIVFVDDLMAFEKPAANELPRVSEISLLPIALQALPKDQLFTLAADDDDGAVVQVEWDFGDGTRALAAAGTHRAALPGTYTATIQIVDDDGGNVQRAVSWTATDSAFPSLTVASPSESELTVNTPSMTLTGTTTGGVDSVQVSSDRGLLLNAAGAAGWSVAAPLQPGFNRLLIQARTAAGRVVSAERRVRYMPAGALAITRLAAPATVERWEPLQITFAVSNSAATQPQFPYAANMPPGLQWADGISVEGLFTPDNWVTVYRRPAFLYQPYQRALKHDEEWLYPQGQPVWAVRFAPPSLGSWRYRLEVQEARGTARSEEGVFAVTAPSNPFNHGPVQVAPNDPRYFEFADGTPFLGSGYNVGFSEERFSYDAERQFTAMGTNNENFFRWWLGGNLWGSAWQPWNSQTLSYDGYLPATGLTLDRAYANGLASLKLDDANPVMIYGWMSGQVGLIPGNTYRFRVRWRTEGVTGPAIAGQPFGATLKFTSWLDDPYKDTLSYPAIIPHVTGDTPWHVSESTFVAQNDYPTLQADGSAAYIAVARENATGGAVYVDEIGLYEDLGNGATGPQLLRNPNFNAHLTFDPRRADGLDAILAAANAQGKYFKLVVSEKNEFLINHFGADGLPDLTGGFFNAGPGSPTNWLHQAYWRYLFARYGAYRSVQSWELANEEAPEPGPHFQLTAQLAAQAQADGNPHLASTSTWATLAEAAWKAPESAPLSYVDFHAYVRSTGWLEPKEALANDSARFFNDYDLAAQAANFGKPVVWGEQGIDGASGNDNQDPDLLRDTAGVWLHKIVWARCGPGGVYPLYWYSDVIGDKNLHAIYGAWQAFMAGIPLTNGHYQDVAAKVSSSNLRVLGQRDLPARQAYVWIDNRQHTWRAVVDDDRIPPASGSVRIALQQPNAAYTVAWYDTQTGTVTKTETITADDSGAVTLSVTNLQTDQAARIAPR